MPNHVPADGKRTARLVLIGEAPGRWEDLRRRPFVGPSGQRLDEWWRAARLSRPDFYIDNVVQYRPPHNDLTKFPRHDLDAAVDALHDRLAALDDPWLIVPTGNTALRALTGQGPPLGKPGKGGAPGIVAHRGSLYEYIDRRNRRIKVIPTIHPAATFRTAYWERRCRADWLRIAADAQFRDLRVPEREHFVRPTLADVEWYVKDAEAHAECLAIDIETPREMQTVTILAPTKRQPLRTREKRIKGEARITCVGFSHDPAFSMTIPTTLAYWKDAESLDAAWACIKRLLALPCEKSMQNGWFDAWWLAARHGLTVRNWRWDTMGMHHAVDAGDDHDLAFQASLLTREPYWKDEAKDPDEIQRYTTDLDAFWTYNGKDAAVQRELTDVHHRRLAADRLLDFYDAHYAGVLRPVLAMSLHGIAMHDRRRKLRLARLRAQRIAWQDALTALAGTRLYGPKGSLSAKKLADYLYGDLRLPQQRDRRTTKVTTKEVVVRKLMLKYPQRGDLQDAGRLILDMRRNAKLQEAYGDTLVDPDGRMRYRFSFSPETGRFSSGKSPARRGSNIQNRDRETRDCFVPDPGCLFLEVDASQAEDRIVKAMTAAGMAPGARRDELLWRARAMPWENDEHKRAATILFRTPLDAVTKDQRQLAKSARHGMNYDEHGTTMSEALLKDGVVLDPDECQRMIDTVHAADPEIKAVYHPGIRSLIMTRKVLVNSWGRRLDFHYERLDDPTYRRGYAFGPQSEVPALVNQLGLRPLHALIVGQRLRTRLHLQGHDSLLVSTPPSEAWLVARFLYTALMQERTYRLRPDGPGVPLLIPVELKLGATWKCDVEWKAMPTRDEFAAAVAALVPSGT